MSYQSNPGRAVQESYDDASATTERLLPGSGINVGASNSALGEGTTTAELVAKLRFFNCGACLFVLLFRTLPIALNPIRLTLLISSPMKLIFEALVGLLALSLLLFEARVPILGEKVLRFTRGFTLGESRYFDLDVARGRVIALTIMGVSLGLSNYLTMAAPGRVPSASSDIADPTSDEVSISQTNIANAGNNDTSVYDESAADTRENEGNAHASTLLIIVQSTVFSPAVLIVIALIVYTQHVVHTFPDYAQSRAYSTEDGTDSTAGTPSSGPSWVSNVGQLAQGASGYQTVAV